MSQDRYRYKTTFVYPHDFKVYRENSNSTISEIQEEVEYIIAKFGKPTKIIFNFS